MPSKPKTSAVAAFGIILCVIAIVGSIVETYIFGNHLLPNSLKELCLDAGFLALMLSGVAFAQHRKAKVNQTAVEPTPAENTDANE